MPFGLPFPLAPSGLSSTDVSNLNTASANYLDASPSTVSAQLAALAAQTHIYVPVEANTGALPAAGDNSGRLGLVGTGASDAVLHLSDGTNWQARVPYQVAANYAAIDPADYVDDSLILAEDTRVLWRVVTSDADSSQRGLVRAVVGGQLIDWNRLDLFNGSGTDVPSDQGFAAEYTVNNGSVTATGGTATHATTTNGDEADVETAVNAAENTLWTAWDISDLDVTVSGSTTNNEVTVLMFHATSATQQAWVRLHSISSTTWQVQPRNGADVDTGLNVATTQDIEAYYDVSARRCIVYSGRAADPTLDVTLDAPESSITTEPYGLITADQFSAGSVTLTYTAAYAMRSTS